MTLVPYGLDATTGKPRPLESSETLQDVGGANAIIASHSTIDHTGIPGTGGKPTEANWESNTETLAGTKTLTDASETVQLLNPDGATRIVNLPAVGANNIFFIIANIGTSGRLDVTSPTSIVPLAKLATGEAIRCISNTSTWYKIPIEIQTATSDQLYPFAGANAGNGQYYVANGDATNDNPTTLQVSTQHAVAAAGTITQVSWNGDTSANGSAKLWVNGVEQETLSIVGTTGTTSAGTAVSAGDLIAIEWDTGTDPGVAWWAVTVSCDMGFCMKWGGTSTAGQHYVVSGGVNNVGTTLGPATKATLPVACNAIRLSYNTTSGDNTTLINVVVNDVVNTGITLGGASGVATTSIALSAGDTIALEYDSGTAPALSIFTLHFDETGSVFAFGGDTTGADYYEPWQTPGTGTTGISQAVGNTGVISTSGNTVTVGWNVQTAQAGSITVYRNGSSLGTVALLSQLSGTGVLTTSAGFVPGDTINIQAPASDPGDSNYQILIQ